MKKDIQDKSYIIASKFAMWAGLLFGIPAHIYRMIHNGSNWTDGLVFLTYFYLITATYLFGYRPSNPPKWSKYFVRQKWLDDLVFLSSAPRKDVRQNKKALILLVIATAALTFAILNKLSA
ncbi:hypothetical protein [Dyella sedimenti]|uniref:hypothetical protein n=1 Tax=Dyella sedimenti TaxID=2919947 RepID=UPI001FAA98EB|nr:hypothetical protein [Dyella sedimenti]